MKSTPRSWSTPSGDGRGLPERSSLRRAIPKLVALFAIATAYPWAAAAQEAPGAADPLPPAEREEVGVWSVLLENDVFYNVDRHYTNGVRLSYTTPAGEVPGAVRRALVRTGLFPEGGRWRAIYSLGQSIYTPRDITDPDPGPTDRPYAGWLYGALGVVAEQGIERTLVELSLGIVGPASLAEQAQESVHRVLNADDPQGWDEQLANEPAVLLTLQRSWRIYEGDYAGFELDVTPQGTLALGNVFTSVGGGAVIRLGRNMPDDHGPPRIRPANAGSPYFETDGFGWYGFAGLEARGVAQNIFLDGNSFQDSPGVDRNPFVGDLQVGLMFAWENMRFGYTHVLRTDEFENQEGSDLYGGLSLSVRF
jgi:hypothetical protein